VLCVFVRRSGKGQIRLYELSSRPLPVGDDGDCMTIAQDITRRQLIWEKLQRADRNSGAPPREY